METQTSIQNQNEKGRVEQMDKYLQKNISTRLKYASQYSL